MSDSDDQDIAEWRRKIDALDVKLIHILSKRAHCAIEIGKIKRRQGLPIYDPKREEEIVRVMLKLNRGPLDAQGVRRLFERIIDESRRIERVTAEGEERELRNGSNPDKRFAID
ncbi:MAG TPA: chorismate mutase [Acidobacteriota bacterium]|nr:chorismate mutase [Acidobacteriota bacterium]